MGSLFHAGRGFTLVEVLVALFVVALGIAGAASLQTLALRSGAAAARLSAGTRLSQSLAEHMRANPAAMARADADNPYLDFDYAAGGAPPEAVASCFGAAACDPDALARFDLYDVAASVADDFPAGHVRVCRDAAPPGADGVPAWPCDGAANAPLVVKLGWRDPGDTGAIAPKLILPLAGGAP